MSNQNNQTAAAIGAITNAVDWEAQGLNLQAIVEAGNQGKLGGPLTKWFIEYGWLTPAQAMKVEVLPKDAELPNGIISINRTTPLRHPEWVKEPLYDESMGPAEIDPSKAEQWLHDSQKTGVVTGTVIHDYLVEKKMIESCYGLRELLAIQAKGIAYFRKHFKGMAVFGWKGTVRHRDDNLHVPYLVDDGGKVILHWYWLDNDWSSRNPALRVASGS